MDLWGMANALGAAVKQQTREITSSLQSTDWRSELAAIQKGLKEETEEMGQRAKTVTEELSHRTREVARRVPTVVDEGRRKAIATLEQLPTSGTSVQNRAKEATVTLQRAGTSLTNFSQRIMTNTTELFDQLSNTIQTELTAAHGNRSVPSGHKPPASLGQDSFKFSRFETDVTSMQRDSSTYCDEPEDVDHFSEWQASFDLEAAKPEIARLISDNTFMSELQSRIVPVVVTYDDFWTRYFYRLKKLEEKHAQLAALTMRGMDEDEVGWGSEEEEEEDKKPEMGVEYQIAVAAEHHKEEESAPSETETKTEELAPETLLGNETDEIAKLKEQETPLPANDIKEKPDTVGQQDEATEEENSALTEASDVECIVEEVGTNVVPDDLGKTVVTEPSNDRNAERGGDDEQKDPNNSEKGKTNNSGSLVDLSVLETGVGEGDLDEDWGDDVADWE